MTELLLVVMTLVVIVLLVSDAVALHDAPPPIPRRPHPSLIFRIVERDDRGAYVRIMRKTYAVALRDFNRQVSRAMRELGRALRPVVDRLEAEIRRVLG